MTRKLHIQQYTAQSILIIRYICHIALVSPWGCISLRKEIWSCRTAKDKRRFEVNQEDLTVAWANHDIVGREITEDNPFRMQSISKSQQFDSNLRARFKPSTEICSRCTRHDYLRVFSNILLKTNSFYIFFDQE